VKTLLLTVVLIAFASTSFADQPTDQDIIFPQKLTAEDLMYSCSSSYLTITGRLNRKYCFGFISGVEESVRLHDQLFKSKNGQKICLPKGQNAKQYAKIYTQYASKQTTDLNKPAALVVIEAFKNAFPCSKK